MVASLTLNSTGNTTGTFVNAFLYRALGLLQWGQYKRRILQLLWIVLLLLFVERNLTSKYTWTNIQELYIASTTATSQSPSQLPPSPSSMFVHSPQSTLPTATTMNTTTTTTTSITTSMTSTTTTTTNSTQRQTPSNIISSTVSSTSLRRPLRSPVIPMTTTREHCAILFFGLPRAFKTLVLPSIQKNIIPYNAGCDYYIHYYNQTQEGPGRGNAGGILHTEDVLALSDAILEWMVVVPFENDTVIVPRIEFISDTEEEFWQQYNDLFFKINTTKDNMGRSLYFPWKDGSYWFPSSTNNVVKMWHSIQSVFQLMESNAITHGIDYETVAMLRSDVVYVTPIPITETAATTTTTIPTTTMNATSPLNPSRAVVTIPGFSMFPVSDRMIYGPIDAVRVWATERFPRLDEHVQYILHNDVGFGMHSERFLDYTIFPAIRQQHYIIQEHPSICFLRARPDQSIITTDCTAASLPSIMEYIGTSIITAIEGVLGPVNVAWKPYVAPPK